MTAEGFVIVVAGTQCQRQIFAQAPLVFGEDGPGFLLERGLSDAVVHLGFPPLAANRGDVRFAHRRDQFGVQYQIGRLQFAWRTADGTWDCGRGADCARNGAANGFGRVVH